MLGRQLITYSMKEEQMKIFSIVFFALLVFYVSTMHVQAQWVPLPHNELGGIYSLAASGTNLFAGTGNGVYLSTDKGLSWKAVNTGLTYPTVQALAVIGANLFAGTVGGGGLGGLFFSTNNGTSWLNTNLTTKWVFSLQANGTGLFVGTDDRVFHAISNGSSWAVANTSSGINDARVLALMGENLYAATGYMGIFRSTNNSTSWTKIKNDGAMDLAVIGTNIFVGMSGGMGVYRSTDSGGTWTQENVGLSVPNVQVLAVSGKNLFAGTFGNGVYLSTNNATNWTEVNDGLPQFVNVNVLEIIGADLFACTDKGIYRRSLTEMVTGVNRQKSEMPQKFRLDQNYPNPFNPTTTISFSLPSKSFVTLKIYDVLAKEVATLVNDELPAGTHSLTWNAGGAPSGVYFYQFQAGSYRDIKRLSLIK
jgi:hypothetical protein